MKRAKSCGSSRSLAGSPQSAWALLSPLWRLTEFVLAGTQSLKPFQTFGCTSLSDLHQCPRHPVLHLATMADVEDRLADVTRRIAESEDRIAKERARLDEGGSVDPLLSAVILESTENTLRELRSYKARLEDLIALNANARRT